MKKSLQALFVLLVIITTTNTVARSAVWHNSNYIFQTGQFGYDVQTKESKISRRAFYGNAFVNNNSSGNFTVAFYQNNSLLELYNIGPGFHDLSVDFSWTKINIIGKSPTGGSFYCSDSDGHSGTIRVLPGQDALLFNVANTGGYLLNIEDN